MNGDKLVENPPTRHVYDGFIHRPFSEDRDGWVDTLPLESDYPSVTMARDVLALYNELCVARRRIWELEQRLISSGMSIE